MSSINDTINQLNIAASSIFLGISIINFVLGSIGLIFNIVIFIRPCLRDEPCSLYFFSSTCYNLFVVFVVMPTRVLSNAYNISASNYNFGICKIEYFIFYVTRATSVWLILSACIDRYLHSSSSANIRQMSSLKTARITVVIISILVSIFYSHMLIYYEIINVSNQYGSITPSCVSQKGFYSTFFGFWHMTVYSICPTFLMLLFGILTLKNLRQRHRMIVRTNMNITIRRTDVQLLRMLSVQVLIIIISTLPFSIYQLYASFTNGIPKHTLRIAQENLGARTTGIMTYFAHSSSFYLYTLTGTVFRREFLKIIRRCWYQNQNRVHINGVETP